MSYVRTVRGGNTTGLATESEITALDARLDALETVALNNQTASYTLVLTDANKLVEVNNAAANTLTVPPNSSVAFPVGTVIDIAQQGAGQTTITAGAGVTLRSRGGALKIAGQYGMASLVNRAIDEWYVTGDLST